MQKRISSVKVFILLLCQISSKNKVYVWEKKKKKSEQKYETYFTDCY